MDENPVTTEQRLSRLEGDSRHLATKADVANAKFELLRWAIGAVIMGMGLGSGITVAILRLVEK